MKQLMLLFGSFCLLWGSACTPAVSPSISDSPSSSHPLTQPPLSPPRPSHTSLPEGYVPPTPVLFPTNTPGPSPTPWPSLQFDLLFLSPIDMNNYKLMRWNHVTDQSDVLITSENEDWFFGQTAGLSPSRIIQYSLTADSKILGVVRVATKAQGANLFDEYELALFELATNQFTSLIKLESPVRWASLSPDGQWFAYILPGDMLTNTSSSAPNLAALTKHSVIGGDIGSARIFVFNINTPEQSSQIGACEAECWSASWSPDSRLIAGSDKQGIWLASLNGIPFERVATGKMIIPTNGRLGVYTPSPWSSSGRYLLVRSQDLEAGEWGVLDIQTSLSGMIPNSNEFPYPNMPFVWLDNGQLFVVRSGELSINAPPSGEIWNIDSDNEALLVLDKSFVIPTSPETYPAQPIQLNDGRLAFIVLATQEANSAESGIYVVSSEDYDPQHVSEALPVSPDVAGVYATWSPDNMGALIHTTTGIIHRFYVPMNGISLASYPQIEGNGPACCFTWVK